MEFFIKAADCGDKCCNTLFSCLEIQTHVFSDFRIALICDKSLIFWERDKFCRFLGVVFDDIRQKDCIWTAVRNVEFSTEFMGHRVIDTQKTLEKAMPAIHEALCIFSLTLRLDGFLYDSIKFSKTSLIA